jgi:hypothetical protein
VQGSQSTARSLRVQSQQLPTESQVFEDEVRPATERTDQPAEEMPERHDHGKNFSGKDRIKLCAKSLISQVYDLLARHSGHRGLQQTRSVSRVLHNFVDQGHQAGDGASNLGQEDCHHRVDGVEERSVLRRPTSETTNSLSVFDRVRSISGYFSGGGRRVLGTLWFESESQPIS